jgi:imidazolonepropionase
MIAKPLAVVNCGQLVTLGGPARPRVRHELLELSIIEHGAMFIRNGAIERVGPQATLMSEFSSDYDVLDARNRVVLPGFVDAHTHPIFAGTRVDEFEQRAAGTTYEESAAAGGGIRSTVRKTRAASEDELFEVAKRRAAWFLRSGTTTLEAKSGYGLTLHDEIKMLRVIRRLNSEGPLRYVSTFLGAHEVPEEYRGRRSEYVDLVIRQMLPCVAREQLAEYCDLFCEPVTFDVPSSRKILEAAKALGFGIRIHADQLTRCGASQLAAEVGATTADHLEQVDEVDIRALADTGVQPMLLPASVYCLGRAKFPPARRMIEAGLALVLATDFNPGSSPTPSIPFVLSLASTQMGMAPAEAITATTINAAYSLGRGQRIGSLEPGKRADFVVHDCCDYREISYFVGVESALGVYIDGQCAYRRNADG